jgi:hypothetical protein
MSDCCSVTCAFNKHHWEIEQKRYMAKDGPQKKENPVQLIKRNFVKNLCQICQIWRNFFWKTCAKFEENLANYCCGWSPLVATSHIIKLIKKNFEFFFLNLNKNPILNHVLNILKKKKKKKKKSTLVFLYAQNWLRVLISWRFVQAEQNRTAAQSLLQQISCS